MTNYVIFVCVVFPVSFTEIVPGPVLTPVQAPIPAPIPDSSSHSYLILTETSVSGYGTTSVLSSSTVGTSSPTTVANTQTGASTTDPITTSADDLSIASSSEDPLITPATGIFSSLTQSSESTNSFTTASPFATTTAMSTGDLPEGNTR